MKKAVWRLTFLGLVLPFLVLAQGTYGPSPGGDACDPSRINVNNNPFDPGCVPLNSVGAFVGIILRFLYFARTMFWILAIAMIMISAYRFLTSGGNEAGIKSGRQTLTWAVVAIVVALVATSIPYLVASFLR